MTKKTEKSLKKKNSRENSNNMENFIICLYNDRTDAANIDYVLPIYLLVFNLVIENYF